MEQHHHHHQRQTYVHWHQSILPLQYIILLGINMYTPVHVSRAYHKAIQFKTEGKSGNGYVYVEISWSIYVLPQSGALANKCLKENLNPHVYFEVNHTPGSWRHITRPISVSLVVDNFGVKYIDKADADHLIAAPKKYYAISEDWTGVLYYGITLKWNYEKYIQKQYVDISLPGYITK